MSDRVEHGPSEKALKAAEEVAEDWSSSWPDEEARDFARAMHDPALGLDRSVCLRDVVDDLRDAGHYDAILTLTDAGWFTELRRGPSRDS